jgi:predicted AlkP superfamily phosphohydrolase/phosphomutase
LPRTRVTLIGLDGGNLPLIQSGCDSGRLPGFASLMRDGAWGAIRSTTPPVSPTAWTSIFTGANPGKHGIFGFVTRRTGSYLPRPFSSVDVNSPYVWKLLSERGIKSAWLSIPFAYPPEPIEGALITGLGTPSKSSNFTYPPELRERIIKEYPDFDVDFNEDQIELSHDITKSLPKIEEVTQANIKLFKELRANKEYRLVAAVFRATDVLQHYVSDPEALMKYFQTFDKLIQECRDTSDEDEVIIVCSDHGFRPVHTSFYVNNWLEALGLLRLKPKPFLASLGVNVETIQKALTSLGLKNFMWKIKRSGLAEIMLKVMPSEDYLGTNIDWAQTQAYYLGNEGGAIYINVRGREPDGIVEKGASYEELVDNIVAEALRVVDPKLGKRVLAHAYRARDIYSGTLNQAPDILLEESEGYAVAGGYNYADRFFGDVKSKIGDHSMNGILFMVGKGVKQTKIEGARLIDMSPTILWILGEPGEFDGRILEEAFEGEPTRTTPSEEIRELRNVINRLKEAGKI